MKILFCTNAFEQVTNGPAKFANLIGEINALYPEHQVRILTEDVTPARLPALPHVYRVQLRIPRLLKPLGQVLRMFQYYRRVQEVAREFPYDVLVYNNAFTGLYAALVSPKPTVGMINDEKNLSASLAAFSPDRWWLKKFFFRFLEKAAARRHRLVITNSEYLRRRVTLAYGLPPAKVRRLYKAIALQETTWQPRRTFGDPVKVLFVKADYRVGNLAVLVQALERLAPRRFSLAVIGPEKQFEDHVRSLAGAAANVQLDYLGPQPQAVVYRYLGAYDLFCVPSATEAFGVANIEALASGIPVVSSWTGGIPEVLDGGNNGWLTEPGNAADLAAAIGACLGDEADRLARAANGKKFIGRFSKEEMFRTFLTILGEACG
ncbi:MAG: glycosyltransferase family 4 protein [Cytophagales bacterium]|nr:glycosyltransferase family 4 protein [Cytophagales bacterium]